MLFRHLRVHALNLFQPLHLLRLQLRLFCFRQLPLQPSQLPLAVGLELPLLGFQRFVHHYQIFQPLQLSGQATLLLDLVQFSFLAHNPCVILGGLR
jgi:hypothetical protein